MKRRIARVVGPWTLPVLLIGVIGCNARTPLQLDAQFASAGVDKIVLLPVIDARPDRFDYVVLGRNVADATVRLTREKGYAVTENDTYAQRPQGPIDVDSVTAEALLGLAPEDVGDFLVVQIERMDRTIDELGASYTVRLSGLLVDREGGRVLWRDSASAANNLTGMFTVMSHGSSQYEAAVNASRALLQTLPPGPGGQKSKKRR